MPLNFLDDFLANYNAKMDEENRKRAEALQAREQAQQQVQQQAMQVDNSPQRNINSFNLQQKSMNPAKITQNNFLSDLFNIGKATFKTSVLKQDPIQTAIDLAKGYANDGKTLNDNTMELARGASRVANTYSLGALRELTKNDKVLNDLAFNDRQGGGKVADFAYDALGYLIPGAAAYKGLNATKLGKGLTDFGAQNLGKRLVSEAAKGAAIGAGLSSGEVGAREAINPQDYNWQQNLTDIGMNTALGAVADPLLYGAGKALQKGASKGLEVGLRKLLPQDLPAPSGKISNDVLSSLTPLQRENLIKPDAQPLNIDPLANVKRYVNPNQPLNEFLGKPQAPDSPLMQMAKKANYTSRDLPKFGDNKTSIDSTPNDIISQHFGVNVPKGDLIDTAPPEYWQKRYEDFTKYVKDSGYNENNLSHESINELWTHFAKPDEPSLSKVVDLAYTGYKEPKVLNTTEVWNQMGNRPPVSKNAKNIMGLDNFGQLKPVNKPVPPIPDLLPEMTVKKTIYKPSQQVESQINTKVPEQTVNVPETSVNASQVPKQAGDRSFFSTVQNPDKLSPELQQMLNEFDKSYKPMSNEELVKYANDYVGNDSEKAYQFVKSARKFDPRHITVGHRLIDDLQKAGEYNKALDVVERLAEQGTKAGQSIQSYSIYNRLTPEGQLLRAQRHVNKVNQNIADPAKQVKLSEQNVQDITQTADSIRRFTGQEDQANNVIKIMDGIKKGNQPTDAELEVVRSFVSDAKKFVSDLEPGAAPKQPKPIKDIRTRDKVVDFMSKREEVARERLKSRMNRVNSLPVDMFYDLSIIGASKIAKGTVRLADFTEEMAKEFGDVVRPYAKQIYNKAAETFNLQSESMTRQRLSEVEKITNKALKDKNLDADQAESIREFARQVGLMSGDAKLESSMELQSILQTLENPTFGQKLSAAQTIAQLLNPKTIVRNAIGNEVFYRVEQLNKLVATPVDILRSKITGGDRTITFRSYNQGQYWKNFLTGAKAGWNGVNPMGLTTAYDIGPQSFRSKFNPLTYLEKSLGATLRSFDHAGYMRAYNKTLGEMANLRAINEGLTGNTKKEAIARYVREADDNLIQIADKYGKYATFQDNTALSNALQKVKRGMNKVSTLGATDKFGLGDMILKYPKTPGNLVMRALEYSPAGLVRSASLLRDFAKTKNPVAEREMALSLSRAITGTLGFSVLGYFLADKGILTSSGNSDYEVASLEKNAGKQPNSVNISALQRFVSSGFNQNAAGVKQGDSFISYDWAQPISIAIALGTGVSQSVKESGKLGLTSGGKGAIDSAANTIINQSVLKGLNDFLANTPGRTMSDRVGDATKGIAGSFIPTALNQARQLNDNTSRNTYSPDFLGELKNKAFNRVPSIEKSLPPSYDTLGNQKQTYQNGGNDLFNVFLNPSFVSKYKPSPEAKFVLDYINTSGDKSAAPRIAPKKLDGIPLTGQQQSKMQKIMGEEVQRQLEVAVPQLQGSNDLERIKKALDKILANAGKTAREEIRNERGDQMK